MRLPNSVAITVNVFMMIGSVMDRMTATIILTKKIAVSYSAE